MASEKLVLQPGRYSVRLVQPGTGTGAVTVLGRSYQPTWEGLNGRNGWQKGSWERRLYEEGTFQLLFPNGPGPDGREHRDRFLILTDSAYRPGDEWLEVWRGEDLMFTGTPTKASVNRGQLTLSGYDGLFLGKRTRETQAGFWAHAPRDVLEHYLGAWQVVAADDFAAGGLTLSTSQQVSPNGVWDYKNVVSTAQGTAHLQCPASSVAWIYSHEGTIPIGIGSSGQHNAWRAEARVINLSLGTSASTGLTIGLTDGAGTDIYYFQLRGDGVANLAADGVTSQVQGVKPSGPGPHYVAIEGRQRWVYYYWNGQLLGIMPMAGSRPVANAGVTIYDSAGVPAAGEADLVVFRRTQPLLLNRAGAPTGDYKTPGAPPPAGLYGSYYTDADLAQAANAEKHALKPDRKPYRKQQDAAINFALATAGQMPTGMPAGPPNGENFSVRWGGSIYLDLSSYDVAIRANATDRVRVWIGRTRIGEQLLDDWTSGGHAGMTTTTGTWLKAGSSAGSAPSGSSGWFYGKTSGWYPIVIEYSNSAGAGGVQVEYQRSNNLGVWTAVGDATTQLSPVGIFEGQIRNDSHYDVARSLIDTFALQATVVPKQLESGEFPGRMEPKARVGRDTEEVVDEIDGVEMQDDIDAENTADALLADAQGLADPNGATQLTAEAFVFSEIERHLFVYQDYEAMSEFTNVPFFLQRVQSLLALRGAPWEQVGVRPKGHEKLLDSFPLTGSLAKFSWDVGDGVRLHLPKLGVVDTTARQIMGVAREFNPAGHKPPVVAFRQRPRNFRDVIRRLTRLVLNEKRNYQKQLVVVNGSQGSSSPAIAPETYSRVSIPKDPTSIVKVEAVVSQKSDTSSWNIEVNGTNRLTCTVPGHYDITPWVVAAAVNSQPECYVRLTGGSGSYILRLEMVTVI